MCTVITEQLQVFQVLQRVTRVAAEGSLVLLFFRFWRRVTRVAQWCAVTAASGSAGGPHSGVARTQHTHPRLAHDKTAVVV
jgi:hypothetical protein